MSWLDATTFSNNYFVSFQLLTLLCWTCKLLAFWTSLTQVLPTATQPAMPRDMLKGLVDDQAACSDDSEAEMDDDEPDDGEESAGSLKDFINDDPSQASTEAGASPEPSPVKTAPPPKILRKRRLFLLDSSDSSGDEASTAGTKAVTHDTNKNPYSTTKAVVATKREIQREEAGADAKAATLQEKLTLQPGEKEFADHVNYCRTCKKESNKKYFVKTDNMESFFDVRVVCVVCAMETMC